MNSSTSNGVCIIIAAKDASQTIGRAIASALDQPETSELIVVDDGSSDSTASAARAADDGTNRLRVVSFDKNRGPAAARNFAISLSSSPIIGVLDSDDFFLSGRLAQLMVEDDWDLIADNIVFMDGDQAGEAQYSIPAIPPRPRSLSFIEFVEGNISRRGSLRGEIGFLKPLMRRSFLDKTGIRYNDNLRLGEDYELYARALAGGARYKIIHSCGYAAVVRNDSLSGRHRTVDLRRLFEADQVIANEFSFDVKAKEVLQRHERHVRDRYDLRHFLDLKQSFGLFNAFGYALKNPSAAWPIIVGILGDKISNLQGQASQVASRHNGEGAVRLLLKG